MKLRSKKNILKILGINVSITIILLSLLTIFDIYWNSFDNKIIDRFYSYIISGKKGPEISNRVILLNISDATYDYLQNNILDRKDVATINSILSDLSPEAVMYDVIFPRASNTKTMVVQSFRRLMFPLKELPKW